MGIDADGFSHGCQMTNVTIDAEVVSHGCQNLKTPKFSGSNFENFLLWNFPTVVNFLKTPIFSRSNFEKFPFLENSHGCQKSKRVPKNQKKSKRILKIIKKFPRSLERAENAKNAWEILENRGKILK